MKQIIKWSFGILLTTVFITSCKKSNDEMMPVQPPPPAINDAIETKPAVQKPVTLSINYVISGYYSAVPANYSLTTKNYPLLIFIPGGGQYGEGFADLPLLLNDGVAQLLDEKIFPPNFTVSGKNFSFVVLTPQLKRYPTKEEIEDFIIYAKKNFRVDTTRIYLSGLSIGGSIASTVAGAYSSQVAAIVPISGEDPDLSTCSSIAKNKVAVWDFHNINDPVINSDQATSFINNINTYNPVIAPKLTIFQVSGHDAWTKAINPTYKENNMNIYEWMLQFSK